jgi:uncharacterized protein (DUF2236 family)
LNHYKELFAYTFPDSDFGAVHQFLGIIIHEYSNMACPAGHNFISPSSLEKQVPYEKPMIFKTITEPHELKNFVEDNIFLLGGQFAILCQFAHPGLARGSYEHSNFAGRLVNRLRTTARFLNAATMGTQAEKEAIFSVIHSAHAEVKGDEYYADDPELHKWTAATLFMALVVVHEAFFGKLPRAKLEALFKESAIYGTSLRMPPEMWPETLDDFFVYWNYNVETLEITSWAKSLQKDLMWPKHIPVYLKPGGPLGRLLTTAWLPERFAREYGMQLKPFRRGLYHLVVAYTAMFYPHLPKRWRTSMSRMYMKDLKKAAKKIEATGNWS